MFKEGLEILKDCLFPIFCFGCRKEGEWVCEKCIEKIPIEGVFCCPLCHQTIPYGFACPWCRPLSSLSQVVAITPYDSSGLIGSLVHAVKYTYATDCIQVFDQLIISFFEEYLPLFTHIDVIVPVPLHPRRFAERGFNQAELFAVCIERQLQKAYVNALKRCLYTKPQAKQDREHRLVQMEQAFVCRDTAAIQGRNVLLIDDVFTTGATMQACAKILLAAGAARVDGFAIAREI